VAPRAVGTNASATVPDAGVAKSRVGLVVSLAVTASCAGRGADCAARDREAADPARCDAQSEVTSSGEVLVGPTLGVLVARALTRH
jgi:hypothetical protein